MAAAPTRARTRPSRTPISHSPAPAPAPAPTTAPAPAPAPHPHRTRTRTRTLSRPHTCARSPAFARAPTPHVVLTFDREAATQIFVGSANGTVSAFYSPSTSVRGVKLCVVRAAKRTEPDVQIKYSPDMVIITPHALPLFRDTAVRNTKRQMEKIRKDPIKSHKPGACPAWDSVRLGAAHSRRLRAVRVRARAAHVGAGPRRAHRRRVQLYAPRDEDADQGHHPRYVASLTHATIRD